VTAERELTAALEATCNTPVGANARVIAPAYTTHPTELELTAWVGRADGSVWIGDRLRGAPQGLDAPSPSGCSRWARRSS